ncbi:sialic acid synthase [Staphylococcus devriesei]|uniref:IucA/IucC family protein n=1 Tax=Staphylococcus devriesei TaxID=586733 RepID=UPI000E67984A|nr:IucA/IucC family protein [Staphylococcus devriesei]RIL71563.1 sialic acid synthase [Staphylococcus devriesei]
MDKSIIVDHLNIEFNQEEYDAYSFLHQEHPHLVTTFEENLLQGRDKISQRLITSLYRENLVNAKDNSKILKSSELGNIFADKHAHVLCIHFPKAKRYLYAQIEGFHAFGRLDVVGPFFYSTSKDNKEYIRIMHPNEVLALILIEAPNLDNDASQQFKDDLENSVVNMTLALTHQAYTMRDTTETLWEIISKNTDSYLRSEQAVIEGHPLHPGAKLRKGLSAQDNIHYSSEYGKEIKLKCVLTHHSVARMQSLHNNYNEDLEKQFPMLYKKIQDELAEDTNLDDYHLMIIHPWQYENILLTQYKKEIESQLIIPLKVELSYYAGLSFRTLMPKYPSLSPHIKLSTNVHITGEIRTLSEQTTHNGPLVTRILNNILTNDIDFKAYKIGIMEELAGSHFYNAQDIEAIQTDRSEQVGTLFRENIYTLIDPQTIPMIPSSLVATYKYNEEAPIISLIKLYQLNTKNDESFNIVAREWITTYATHLLGIVIPLYVKYGIALEAHLQNSIATFNNDGSLNKIYIRDFEGLRIDEQQLNSCGYSTKNFHEKSRILTDSQTTVFNKVFYSTVQNHLGELILTIANYVNDDNFEDLVWQNISDIIKDILANLTNVNTTRASHIQSILFAPDIDYKCVTTMRLEDEAHHYSYIKVDNPLHK